MKVFSFKRLIGLAAVGGAVAYARKHGGFKAAFNELMGKKDELLAKISQRTEGASTSTSSTYGSTMGSRVDEAIGSTGGYTSGYTGNNGLNRR